MDHESKPTTSAARPLKHGAIIPAPKDPADWANWRAELEAWREEMRTLIQYDGSAYHRPEYQWIRSSPHQHFVQVWDMQLLDGEAGCFKIESFLDHYAREFGGIDILLVWPAYPQLAFDDRNQFDMMRDVPGGLPAWRAVSEACHARGAKLFIPYNPWDVGTRREPMSDVDALCQLVTAMDADGIFLDTMTGGQEGLREGLDAVRPGVVLHPEFGFMVDVDNIEEQQMELGPRPREDTGPPDLVRNKWFERAHVHHHGGRDKTSVAHLAWMNGCGLQVSEEAWSVPSPWSPRDRSILRSMFPIQRRYAQLFSGEGWVPLVETKAEGTYASLWEGEGLRLWTVVNRLEDEVSGTLLQVPHREGDRYFDLIAGTELAPDVVDGQVALGDTIRSRGIGALLAGSQGSLGADLDTFLAQQTSIDQRADFNTDVSMPDQVLRPVASTTWYETDDIPAGMLPIPAASYEMTVQFTLRECLLYDVPGSETAKGSWGPKSNMHKPAFIRRQVELTPYAIDRMPVTNRQFSYFLRDTGYQPKHPENFLKHWLNGAPPPNREDHPVVYVDIDDARAYAAWAGKRLPTEEEWQFAAEGPNQLTYPWGDEMKPNVCNDGSTGTTTPVAMYNEGHSPFGCFDMCGNVWHWTESERTHDRVRFCILKGGSYYKAEGSYWYADGGPQPCNFAAKYILSWSGLDRAATIGFRCVVDMAEG